MEYPKHKILTAVLIMLIVTSVVSVGAGVVIGAGFANKNSNIKIIKSIIEKADLSAHADSAYSGLQHFLNLSLHPRDINTNQDIKYNCKDADLLNDDFISTTSLIDYLTNQNMVVTFDYRRELAQSHGITDYRGTEEENKLLLKILINEEFNSNCSE